MAQHKSLVITAAETKSPLSRPGKIISVQVALKGTVAGSNIKFFNSSDGSGTPIYQFDGVNPTANGELNIPFKVLSYTTTGDAQYTVVLD